MYTISSTRENASQTFAFDPETGNSARVRLWIAAVLGHVFPATRRFRGGKGVATASGGAVVLLPLVSLICGVAFVVAILVSHKASVASLTMAVLLPVVALLMGRPAWEVVTCVGVSALVIARLGQYPSPGRRRPASLRLSGGAGGPRRSATSVRRTASARPRRGGRGTSRSCAAGPRRRAWWPRQPKRSLGPGGVDPPAGLAVGLGRVPAQLAVEADESRRCARPISRIGDLVVGAEVDRLGAVVALGGQRRCPRRRRRRRGTRGWPSPVPHTSTWSSPRLHRLDALLDQRGDDVGDRRVELVAGAVEVGRHQVGEALAVLGAVDLGVHQVRLLGDAVRRVGLLGVAVPQATPRGTAPA